MADVDAKTDPFQFQLRLSDLNIASMDVKSPSKIARSETAELMRAFIGSDSLNLREY